VPIPMPEPDRLPPGPHRDLVKALHRLYRGAGVPGLRRITKAVMEGDFRDTVSHEKVAAMLRGDGLPRWTKLEPVVRVLASWHTPGLDVDTETAQLLQLWHAARAGEADMASGLDRTLHGAGPDAKSWSLTGDAASADLVRAVGDELVVRELVERKTETELGYGDGVKFARDLPSWSELEELARVDFDVTSWIKPWREMWGRIAARLDPYTTEMPPWAGKACRYLGNLADPIGFDQFSFDPTEAYLIGFSAGLRAVWEATRSQLPPGPSTAGREARAGSEQIGKDLRQLLRGHTGLSLDDVEHAGRTLLERLRDRFQHAAVRDQLPPGAILSVDWFQASGCDYGDRPYRLVNWHYHGLKVVVTISKPELVRAECTPVPGISRARDADHGLIAIDANRPSERPLLIAIGDVHPHVSPSAANLIDEWVEQCLVTLLTEFGQALTGALARLGYDS